MLYQLLARYYSQYDMCRCVLMCDLYLYLFYKFFVRTEDLTRGYTILSPLPKKKNR